MDNLGFRRRRRSEYRSMFILITPLSRIKGCHGWDEYLKHLPYAEAKIKRKNLFVLWLYCQS